MCWGVGMIFLQQQLELKPCPDSKPRAVPLLSHAAPTRPDQTEAWSPGRGPSMTESVHLMWDPCLGSGPAQAPTDPPPPPTPAMPRPTASAPLPAPWAPFLSPVTTQKLDDCCPPAWSLSALSPASPGPRRGDLVGRGVSAG